MSTTVPSIRIVIATFTTPDTRLPDASSGHGTFVTAVSIFFSICSITRKVPNPSVFASIDNIFSLGSESALGMVRLSGSPAKAGDKKAAHKKMAEAKRRRFFTKTSLPGRKASNDDSVRARDAGMKAQIVIANAQLIIALVLTFLPLQPRRRSSVSGGSAAKVFEPRSQDKLALQKRGEFFAAHPMRLIFGNSGMSGSPSFGYFSWRDKKSDLPPGNPRPTVTSPA